MTVLEDVFHHTDSVTRSGRRQRSRYFCELTSKSTEFARSRLAVEAGAGLSAR